MKRFFAGRSILYTDMIYIPKSRVEPTLSLSIYFSRALAGAIARGLSLHKRSRLNNLRGSKEEAARVAEEAKYYFETGRCSEENGFSARHLAGNMGTTSNSEVTGVALNITTNKRTTEFVR